MSIGQVPDLDAFVEANVTTVADWDANFKMLKVKRRDSEKLPDFQKVDCVNVSLAPFKSSVEDQLQVIQMLLCCFLGHIVYFPQMGYSCAPLCKQGEVCEPAVVTGAWQSVLSAHMYGSLDMGMTCSGHDLGIM